MHKYITVLLLSVNNNYNEGNEQYGSTSGADYAACIVEAVRAMNHGIFPERIAQGSSGSYFVKSFSGVSFIFLVCVN